MEHSDLGGKGEYPHYKLDEHVKDDSKHLPDGALTTHVADGTKHLPLTTSVNYLSSDVALTDANTFYDAISVTLTAGTWLVTAGITFGSPSATAMRCTAKLYAGSTVYGSAGCACADITGKSGEANATIAAVVSPTTSTVYKLAGCSDVAGCNANAAAYPNAAGNTATYFKAIKIG